jgi:hypothetical protein
LSGDLDRLSARGFRDHPLRNSERGHHLLFNAQDAAGRNGAHRQFLLAGDAEFPDQHDIQRCMQSSGDFVADRHPSTGKGQHQ